MGEYDDIFDMFESKKKEESEDRSEKDIEISDKSSEIVEGQNEEKSTDILESELDDLMNEEINHKGSESKEERKEVSDKSLDTFFEKSSKTEEKVVEQEADNNVQTIQNSQTGQILSQITIQETPKEIKIQEEQVEFDFSEETGPGKAVVTIYGHKGHGKTAVALSFPGRIAAISFDRKTKAVAVGMYPNRVSEIKVWDGKKYYDESDPMTKLMSAETTFNYLIQLLDKVIRAWEPDWVLIDGTEIFQEICEMVMRYRNNLMPYQGIANRNLWKERRMYMRQIHNLALEVARVGLIYTLYPREHDIKIVDGEVMDRQEMPGWIDVVMSETDLVLKVRREWQEEQRRILVTVESNKSPIIPFEDGVTVDVTDKNAYEAIKDYSEKIRRKKQGQSSESFGLF